MERNRHLCRLDFGRVRVLVANLADSASVNIRDHLLEGGEWIDTGSAFRGHPMHQRGYDMLVQVDGPTIHDEALSDDLVATGWPIAAVWFLSRHRAESGQPSLTVHPIGNHGAARFGGMAKTLSPAAPRDMGALLRRLKVHRGGTDMPHQVTYEATHHGPLMAIPSLFVEIGSDDTWYTDRRSGQAVAAAVTDVLDGAGAAGRDVPIAVGVGGGHYVPRQTDKALDGELDFGHFLPAYGVTEDAGPQVLGRCIDATPGCRGVYMHKKGLKGWQRQIVKAWCDELGAVML